MIIKIKPYKRPDFFRLLNYMMGENEKLQDSNGKSFTVTHNLKSKRIQQWVIEYRKNEEYRKHKRKNQNYLTHEIISFHKEENVTIEQMEDITREYIHRRNPSGIYVAVPHFDKEHCHIHICASSIEYRTGKSLRMSKAQFQKFKTNIQQYQQDKYPELSKSIVNHGSKKKALTTEKEFLMKLRTGRDSEKEKLLAMLKTCYKKANSRKTFFELIEECGLKVYSRGGKISGVHFGTKKFRLKRIGFTEERLEELDRSLNRVNELQQTRSKMKRNITRNL